MMTTPKALASFALTVNRILGPVYLNSKSASSSDDDELVLPFGDRGDEFPPPASTDRRRFLRRPWLDDASSGRRAGKHV
jgi:hypothetical protein